MPDPKAATKEQKSRIGNQSGGGVFFFLHTTISKEIFLYLIDNILIIIHRLNAKG
jgi:hypothetical protein